MKAEKAKNEHTGQSEYNGQGEDDSQGYVPEKEKMCMARQQAL